MQPKAKWKKCDWRNAWTAVVGPFHLEISPSSGECLLSQWDGHEVGAALWRDTRTVPCDVTDLMRLTEAELARRLEDAAETMDGRDLVAPPFPVQSMRVEGAANRMGVCASKWQRVRSTWHKVLFTDGVVGPLFDENATPYTLPSITSYADLADVLDELPEGWRIRIGTEPYWMVFRRVGDKHQVLQPCVGIDAWLSVSDFSTRRILGARGAVLLPPENAK